MYPHMPLFCAKSLTNKRHIMSNQASFFDYANSMPQRETPDNIKQSLLNLFFVAIIFFIVIGCVCRSGRDEGALEPAQPVPESNKARSNSVDNVAKPDALGKKQDAGDFLVEYSEVKNSKYQEIDRQIKNEKVLETAANNLNRSLILPNDITLRARDCGEVNALYNPEDRSITVCYELMEHFYLLFKGAGKSDNDAYDRMFEAVRFAFLHELGHALIDTYNLPVTGNEEDAADRLSAYICIEELGEDGVKSVLSAADAFAIESKGTNRKGRDLADEHLLQEQRFYNSLCMIYGSDPAKYEVIVNEDYLPKERAVRCKSEYARTSQSWKELLKDWRKD